ncbi:ABC transporter permease [Nocardiopsis suaedae]|uniref:ABC transporter permease n=1 Tax=Nocardiopsis suaedae TaxID=3018444 RepID=A0ABT4TQ29_9ACTN|nr:ABC transporter permease [Nocardiopsis suaedae]MDA2806792.1 ABC transporter permease [Nocardiopsis suaedae]
MTGRAVANEFAKMRRLRTAPALIALVLGVTVLTCGTALSSPGFTDSAGDASPHSWRVLLGSMGIAVPLVSPVLIAVMASRQVDIEHRGNGWTLAHASGVAPGALCRAKFASTGALVAAAVLAHSGLVVAFGRLVGITAPVPAGPWLGYTAWVTVVGLALLALHLLLAAWVPNQLVGLGIAVMGVFAALSSAGMPDRLAFLLPPWGYYGPAVPVGYRDGALVALTPPHLAALLLAAGAGALFLSATRRFDRQEA